VAETKKYKGLQGIRWQFAFSVFGINIVLSLFISCQPILVSSNSLYSISFWLNIY